MILNDIFKNNASKINEIVKLVELLYPDLDCSELIINCFTKCLQKEPVIDEKQLEIHIEKIENEGSVWFDVTGFCKEDNINYAIELTDWNKWLNYAVPEKTLRKFNELEILAHCLTEMIFFGSEESIKEYREDLEQICKDIDEGNCELIPFDDILKKFGDLSVEQ